MISLSTIDDEFDFNSILLAFQGIQQVKAIAIGGSTSAQTNDNKSDVDIYVFVDGEISITKRKSIIQNCSSRYEIGCEYFGSGDEFFVDKLHQQLDVMYWDVKWFEGCIHNVWFKNYPSNGYTTAFVYTLSNFKIVYDKDNWLLNMQKSVQTEYPESLKQNIIQCNMMLMKDKPFASYYEQIEKAINRGDSVSINHRISAFLASYFDVLFAVNNLLHPGEKRLIQYAKDNCKILPKDFEKNINKLLAQPNQETLTLLDLMFENIKELI